MKIRKLFINIIKYLILVFFAFAAVVPVVSCIFTAFKTSEEYQTTNVITPPSNWFYLGVCKTPKAA